MPKTITFYVPDLKYKKAANATRMHGLRLSKKESQELNEVCKELGVKPHFFMRWCVICSVRAVKNGGSYKKLKIFGEI